jgi:hypothetical protein
MKVSKKAGICLTFDVEEWSPSHNYKDTNLSREGCERIIELLRKHKILSTFFVTGYFAQKERETIKFLIEEGHEIGCHSFRNIALTKLNFYQLGFLLKKATKILSNLTGSKIKGFRAPQCKINERVLSLLEKLGYRYDSSIHPIILPSYYYNQKCPLEPYYPNRRNILKKGDSKILEIPISVIPVFRFPISWWWMRNLSVWLPIIGAKLNLSRKRDVILYFHTWEFVKNPKSDKVPYHIIRKTGDTFLQKLDYFIKKFKRCKFKKMEEILNTYELQVC